MPKTESEIKLELEMQAEQKKAVELAEQVKTSQAALDEKEKEITELKQFKAQAEAKAIEAQKALAESQMEKEILDLQNEKLISPAMKPYVKAFLSEEKKEYAFQAEDKKDVKLSKSGLLKEILKLHSATSSVNMEESSEDHKVEGDKEKADHKQIEQYAKDHKVSYSAAYKAVKKTG